MDTNFFAPAVLEGFPNVVGDFYESCYTPILTINVGGLSEVQNQYLQLDSDADFILHGVQLTDVEGDEPYSFKWQITDGEGQSLTNGYVYGIALAGNGYYTVPFPIVPARPFRAGSFVTFSFVNYSSNSIRIQLALRGVKRRPNK